MAMSWLEFGKHRLKLLAGNPVLAAGLALVEKYIDTFDEGVSVIVLSASCGADGCCDSYDRVVEPDMCLGDLCPNPFSHGGESQFVGERCNHHELLTSPSAREIGLPNALSQRFSDEPQDPVSSRVAVAIIDRFEIV